MDDAPKADEFHKAARELACDHDEQRFQERERKLMKQKRSERLPRAQQG